MLTMPKHVESEVVVPASPEAVWAVLTDVTRVGEWSHEAHTAAWLDGPRDKVGARFRGANRNGVARWSKFCTITEYDAPRRFCFTTSPTRIDPGVTAWEFDLELVEGGTRVRQAYRVLSFRRAHEIAYCLLIPAHRDRSAALREDLVRLGEVAAQSPLMPSP